MTGGLQPFLSDRVVALAAPTQVWSASDGDLGTGTIDGIYHGDTRFIRSLVVEYIDDEGRYARPEWVRTTTPDAGRLRVDGVLRGVDDAWPDPKVRLERVREVTDGAMAETLTVRSHRSEPITVTLRTRWSADFAPLQEVKAGAAPAAAPTFEHRDGVLTVSAGGATLTVDAPGAETVTGDDVSLSWQIEVPAYATRAVTWSVTMDDPSLVVRGVSTPVPWAEPAAVPGADPRLQRWLGRALGDLTALRLTLPDHPDDAFFAAGAPWFFTLFGRDSLWAARLLLPLDVSMAASTLRVLARLQGHQVDPATAEQPGKIMHELRASTLSMPGEGIVLPPLYYGTVDATALWVCLLVEAAEAGMPADEVRELLPHLQRALDWITSSVGRHGFLDYVDETGHGLSNQGWKDSGDSIQWRDGTLAQGPIALCEVQAYAYEAAMSGAELLEEFGEDGIDEAGAVPTPSGLRAWAAQLRARFAASYWVSTPEGRYPAVALDRDKRPVDTLTSNIGHLLGTGLLDPAEEAQVAALLVGPTMSSGFGIRTMSTDAAGYWPLSYHGGSVWTHDSAICAYGMMRAGLVAPARQVAAGLLAAAEGFDYRVPELHSGDPAGAARVPVPYPAACRPQAWSAAAAITCREILRA